MTDKQKRIIIWAAVSSTRQGADDRESIPDQLKRQRDRAAANGWLVVDEIIVQHSREYLTYDEFSQAAAADGWPDPLRMWAHWSSRDFDILSCRDLDRVGREQSILAEFVSRCIRAGATILPLDSSGVDPQNYRFASAMGGMGASEHIDKMKRGRDIGMKGRAKRGEQLSWRLPMFYIKDADGKLIPNRETFQRLFDDIYEVFTAGTSYEQIPVLLEARGHVHPKTGKRYDKTIVKRLLISARTWGNAEYNRTGTKRGHMTVLAEPWCTGRGEPPADVFFQRDVCEPIWAGQQREAMIDELERRFYAIRGASRPNHTYSFSQLCVCDDCGRNMAVQRVRNSESQLYVICHRGRLKQGCANYKAVHFNKLEEFIGAYIAAILRNPAAVFSYASAPKASRIPALDREISKLDSKIDNWLEVIAEQAASNRAAVQNKIDAATTQRETLKRERAAYEITEREHKYQEQSRLTTLKDIQALGVDNLWSQPAPTQNQFLRKVLGNLRVVCRDGEPVGLRVVEVG